MYRRTAFLAIAAFAALTACTSHPLQVRVDQNPAHSVAVYRTFGFFEQPPTDSARYQTLLISHLQASTRLQMEARGYVYSRQNPQLLVNFLVDVQQHQHLTATPAGGIGLRAAYRGVGGYDIDTITIQQGALTIDVVDAAERSIVWQGVGEGAVAPEAERNTGTAVHGVVSRMFRDFPLRAL